MMITKGTGGLGSWWTSVDHPNYNIIENGQNTEKSAGDLRTCCHSNSYEISSANADVKNSEKIIISIENEQVQIE